MSGDIVTHVRLSDADYTRGLNRMAAATGSFAAKARAAGAAAGESFVRQSLGMQNVARTVQQGLALGFGIAAKAVADYAKQSDYAAAQQKAMAGSGAALWKGIGRDISHLVDGVGKFGDGIEELRGKIVNAVSRPFKDAYNSIREMIGLADTGTPEDVDDATALDEQITAKRRLDELLREVQGSTKAAGGNTFEADRNRVQAASAKRLEALAAIENLSVQQRAAAQKAIKEEEKAHLRAIDQRVRAEEQARTVEAAKRFSAAKEEARIRAAKEEADRAARGEAADSLNFELERLKVDDMRLDGRQKEADLLEAEVEARRRIYDIQRDQLLSEEDRARAVDAINGNLRNRQAAIERGAERIRGVTGSLAVGLAGVSGIGRQVFGGGTTDRDAAFQKRVVTLLDEFKRAIRQPGTLPMAVYGP